MATTKRRARAQRIAAAKRRLYAVRKAKGLVRKEIWAPAALWPALLELIDDVKMGALK
jgi:hypothetical protein